MRERVAVLLLTDEWEDIEYTIHNVDGEDISKLEHERESTEFDLDNLSHSQSDSD